MEPWSLASRPCMRPLFISLFVFFIYLLFFLSFIYVFYSFLYLSHRSHRLKTFVKNKDSCRQIWDRSLKLEPDHFSLGLLF
jgi:CBS domain containing-hemolysin-like protein